MIHAEREGWPLALWLFFFLAGSAFVPLTNKGSYQSYMQEWENRQDPQAV